MCSKKKKGTWYVKIWRHVEKHLRVGPRAKFWRHTKKHWRDGSRAKFLHRIEKCWCVGARAKFIIAQCILSDICVIRSEWCEHT
jgi:hypothetical protein